MIKIQISEGKVIRVNGRLEKMICWLVGNDEKVTRPDRVQIGFDCAGPDVNVEVKVREAIPH